MRLGGPLNILSHGSRWVIGSATDPLLSGDPRRPASRSVVAKIDDWCDDVMTWPDMLGLYEELSGERLRPPTTLDVNERVKPRLRQAFEDGILVAIEQPLRGPNTQRNEEGVHARRGQVELPLPPRRSRPASPPKALHSFAIRIVDELGVAIAGLDLSFVHGGAKDQGTTDGNGVARLEDSPVRTATASIVDGKDLRKKLKARWEKPRGDRRLLADSDGVTVVPLGREAPFDLVADKLRVISVQPYVARVRLIGPYFDTNKSLVLPGVRRALPAVVSLQRELDSKKVLIVGHCDTTGQSSYNDRLSVERAEAVKDLLLGNVSGWSKWYGGDVAAEKRWGKKEDLAMIDALPDGAERAANESPVRWFQRTRGLIVDGVAGAETRRALIGEYMRLDEKLLPGSDLVVHGCGESFPDKETGDETEEPDNRRIEIFLFDTELGVQPAPSGEVSSAGSTDYPEWVKRSQRTDDFAFDGISVLLRIVDVLGEPLAGAPYELLAGSLRRVSKTDAKGLLDEEQIPKTASCTLRWALPPRPGDPSPVPPVYDFEREILLDLGGHERDESAKLRLHNLGYAPDLNESVHQFQHDFGLAKADWFDEKTWNEIRRIHDDF